MNHIVFFDIDHTLFDTEKIRPFLNTNISWKDQNLPFSNCLYSDTRETLISLNSLEYCRLGVFSQCVDLEYQKAKLKETNIEPYFDKELIFISTSKVDMIPIIKEKVAGETIWFVDDRPVFLNAVKQGIDHVKTVRIRRGRYVDEVSVVKPSYEIDSLEELTTIVSS